MISVIVLEWQGDMQMRMPLQDDFKAEELITDAGGNTEGPEAMRTVDEYLMPQKWTDEEKKTDEVRPFTVWELGIFLVVTVVIDSFVIIIIIISLLIIDRTQ